MDTSVPYRYTVTLPTQSPPAYGLILLSNRQVTWTVDIPDNFVPTGIPNPLRDAILSHISTITRTATIPARPTKGDCTIYCWAFHDLTASHCYKLFRDAAIATLHHDLTAHEHRGQNTTTTRIDQLSPPVHALLQVLDFIQPASRWQLHRELPRTVIFTPTVIDYNCLRNQAQSYIIDLRSPVAMNQTLTFSIRPPKAPFRHARGRTVEPLVAHIPPHKFR